MGHGPARHPRRIAGALAIWQYLVAVDASRKGNGSGWRYVAATAAYVFAQLSKPTAVAAPVIAAGLQVATEPRMYMRGFRASTQRSAIKPLILRPGFWLILALPRHPHHPAHQPIARATELVPILHRPIVAIYAIAFYVWKTVWPVHLCTDYGRVPWKIFADGQAYWTWIVPVGIGGLLIFARRMPMVIAGAAVYVLGLLPVLGLVGFDYQGISTVADRYLYLPMFGMASSWRRYWRGGGRAHRVWAVAATTGILGLLAFRTFALAWTWHDNQSLWCTRAGGQSAEHCRQRHAFPRRAACEELSAGDRLRRAIHPRQRVPAARLCDLANVYAQMGRTKDAVSAMMQAYRLEPRDPQVLVDLGVQLVNDQQLSARYSGSARRWRSIRITPRPRSTWRSR